MYDILSNDVKYLKGVGEKRARQLYKLGVFTVSDLLYLLPKRYIDFSQTYDIAYAPIGENIAVRATVLQLSPPQRIKGGRVIYRVECADDTARLILTFFNSEYTVKQLQPGVDYIFYGKCDGGFHTKQMIAPIFMRADSPIKKQPVYPLTAGLSAKMIQKYIATAFSLIDNIPDFLPNELLNYYKLPTLYKALYDIHFPKNNTDLANATKRLRFDELFVLQLGMSLLNRKSKALSGAKIDNININDLLNSLPYTPTRAQSKCVKDILADFKSGYAMNRLLQGDVGSGKTLVAICAMYCMTKNGYQSIMMAPTEILANQHFQNVKNTLSKFGVRVALLTASVKAKEKRELLALLEKGEIDILIGTNAVLSEKVIFANLGLVITDEQHRFGVNQRSRASAKGENPHILVMSATPIPRTLAMIIYADMQISVIDEMPKGRKPVQTLLVDTSLRQRMFNFIDKHIQQGYQTYIVLPAIEENTEMSDLQSVEKYCNEIVRPILPHAKVGILHGKMKSAEKDAVMQQFTRGKIDILCSTTVVEVGVDVPNRALMIIENAERYGLSALHQLRGRVGRGDIQSYCILVTDKKESTVQNRLKFLVANPSGFAVAQYDLENRGPGDFFGTRQHGLPIMKTASLVTDTGLIDITKQAASVILTKSPDLSAYPQIKKRCEGLFKNMTL